MGAGRVRVRVRVRLRLRLRLRLRVKIRMRVRVRVQLHPVQVDLGVEPRRESLDPQPAQQPLQARPEPGNLPVYKLGAGAVQLAHAPQDVLDGHGEEREAGRDGQVSAVAKLPDD